MRVLAALVLLACILQSLKIEQDLFPEISPDAESNEDASFFRVSNLSSSKIASENENRKGWKSYVTVNWHKGG